MQSTGTTRYHEFYHDEIIQIKQFLKNYVMQNGGRNVVEGGRALNAASIPVVVRDNLFPLDTKKYGFQKLQPFLKTIYADDPDVKLVEAGNGTSIQFFVRDIKQSSGPTSSQVPPVVSKPISTPTEQPKPVEPVKVHPVVAQTYPNPFPMAYSPQMSYGQQFLYNQFAQTQPTGLSYSPSRPTSPTDETPSITSVTPSILPATPADVAPPSTASSSVATSAPSNPSNFMTSPPRTPSTTSQSSNSAKKEESSRSRDAKSRSPPRDRGLMKENALSLFHKLKTASSHKRDDYIIELLSGLIGQRVQQTIREDDLQTEFEYKINGLWRAVTSERLYEFLKRFPSIFEIMPARTHREPVRVGLCANKKNATTSSTTRPAEKSVHVEKKSNSDSRSTTSIDHRTADARPTEKKEKPSSVKPSSTTSQTAPSNIDLSSVHPQSFFRENLKKTVEASVGTNIDHQLDAIMDYIKTNLPSLNPAELPSIIIDITECTLLAGDVMLAERVVSGVLGQLSEMENWSNMTHVVSSEQQAAVRKLLNEKGCRQRAAFADFLESFFKITRQEVNLMSSEPPTITPAQTLPIQEDDMDIDQSMVPTVESVTPSTTQLVDEKPDINELQNNLPAREPPQDRSEKRKELEERKERHDQVRQRIEKYQLDIISMDSRVMAARERAERSRKRRRLLESRREHIDRKQNIADVEVKNADSATAKLNQMIAEQGITKGSLHRQRETFESDKLKLMELEISWRMTGESMAKREK
ncbi:hypothetical protein PROFUN_07570 [Planoprotostelium fungivorum]|uniref:Uncharacterized protein n=1 Tax=Planoprotostelium fungivorum TaxID=1890364 RepID=A0A2P6NLS5_9EUKA|nr:hypothetical protein PROFUN_07570 [Planoprotostelium fungivorum]